MKIGLLGYGTVGKGVYDLLLNSEHTIVKILDNQDQSLNIITKDFDEVINSDIDTIIECLPNIPVAYEYVAKALNKGINVITSNKALVANHFEELYELTIKNHCYITYEASVAGGIPWLHALCDLKTNDKINSFMGIFNGTTNYILDRMFKENIDFDSCLNSAIELGYAEKNYSSDVDGIDTKYKIFITHNLINNSICDLDDIVCYGIRYINSQVISYCKANNLNCKLIGYGDRNNLFVMPMLVSNEHILAKVDLNNNATIVNTKNMNNLSFIGQGAGRYPTANAICLDVKRPLDSMSIDKHSYITNDYQMSYFLSEKVIDDKYIIQSNDQGHITKKLSIKKIKELIGDKEVFVGGIYDQSC